MDKITDILKEIGIPFAYSHFAEGENPKPPFICYSSPKSDGFSADGLVYQKLQDIRIELYTDKKDLDTEEKLENTLDNHNIFYKKSETWIDSEKLYEVLYQFEILGGNYEQ